MWCRGWSTCGRYYDPKTALFITVDPDLSQTGIPYAYTGDSPLTYTDLLGLCGGFFGFVCSTGHWLSKPGHIGAVLGVAAVVASVVICPECDLAFAGGDLIASGLADAAFGLSAVQAGLDCSKSLDVRCGVAITASLLAGAGGFLDTGEALFGASEGAHAAESIFEGLGAFGRIGDAFSVPFGVAPDNGEPGSSDRGEPATAC